MDLILHDVDILDDRLLDDHHVKKNRSNDVLNRSWDLLFVQSQNRLREDANVGVRGRRRR